MIKLHGRVLLMALFMAAVPIQAAEDDAIIRLYDQYNAQLKRLNLAEPISLIEKEKIAKANRLFANINTRSLRSYYSDAMNRTNDECQANSLCRMSDMIGLHVQTMENYRVAGLEKTNERLVTLILVGTNAPGSVRKVEVRLVLENAGWKIDQVMTGPPD